MEHYRKLADDEFRLLSFTDDKDYTSCKLDVYKVAQAPPYIALSYTWGDALYRHGRPAGEKYNIKLYGKPFEIQQNLDDAFRHLASRVRDNEGLIWIDAVCINQRDNVEKSRQVAQMRQIFETAHVIYAWLGVPRHDSEIAAAIELMQRLTAEFTVTDPWGRLSVAATGAPQHWALPKSKDSLWRSWHGVKEICNRPYWTRLWIHQEASSPGDVLMCCGYDVFDIRLLVITRLYTEQVHKDNLFQQLDYNLDLSFRVLQVAAEQRWRRGKQKAPSLLDLLQRMRHLKCTDDKDRVFAPLSLHYGTSRPSKALRPILNASSIDYDCDIVDLYIATARQLISGHDQDNLNVLGLTGLLQDEALQRDENKERKKPGSLPSWVPDWRYNGLTCCFSHAPEWFTEPLYDPCSDTTAHTSGCGTELELTANVSQAGEFELLSDAGYANIESAYKWYDLFAVNQPADIDASLRRTLVADKTFSETGDWERGGMMDWQLLASDEVSLDASSSAQRHRMMTAFFKACDGNRMARLKGGILALVPKATEVGDQIAAFHGGHSLYVIRPVPERNDAYIYVGECYVDGLMDGAFMDVCKESGDEARRITLV